MGLSLQVVVAAAIYITHLEQVAEGYFQDLAERAPVARPPHMAAALAVVAVKLLILLEEMEEQVMVLEAAEQSLEEEAGADGALLEVLDRAVQDLLVEKPFA